MSDNAVLSPQEKREIAKEVGKDVKKKVKKVKKAIKETYGAKFHKFLKMHNPYLAAILDPWNVHGVKIPDMNSQGSATFSCALRSTVLTNATGNCFIAFGRGVDNTPDKVASLIPMPPPSVGTGSNYRIGYSNNDPSCSPTNLNANGGTNPIVNYYFDVWAQSSSAVPSTFQRARLVSAGLAITVQCSLATAQGKITIAALPRWKTQSVANTQTLSQAILEAQPGVRIININQLAGASSIYVPIDPVSLQYVDLGVPYSTGSDYNPMQGYAGGELLCSVTGAGAAISVQFVLVANYEGLPKYNNFTLVTTTPSPVDTLQLESALNAIQTAPTSYIGVQKAQGQAYGIGEMDVNAILGAPNVQYSTAKTAHAAMQQTTASNPMGMLGNILEKLPGFIDKGMAIGEKLAPMAESLAALF